MTDLSIGNADTADTAATPIEESPVPVGESGEPLLSFDSPLFREVSVTVQARLGELAMPMAELLALRSGSVLTLPTSMNEPVGLYLNDVLIGRGEIVAVGDNFGLRIVEIAAK